MFQESVEEGGANEGDGVWDLSTMREDEFEQHVVYIVPDVPTEPGCPNRAESSLPRNLVLKPSQALSDVSITTLPSKLSFLVVLSIKFHI